METPPEDDLEAIKRQIAELQAKQARLEAAEKAKAPVVFQESVKAERDVVAGDKIINNYPAQNPAESVIPAYLEALSKDLAGLKLSEIDASPDTTRKAPLQLADVYVPLNANLRIPEGRSLAGWLDAIHGRRQWQEQAEPRETRPVALLEALAVHRKLTVLGKPGSGKSTFGASVLLALAQARLGHPQALDSLGEGWTHGLLLPVRITLRRFAARLPPGKEKARAADLWDAIGAELRASHPLLPDNTMDAVKRLSHSEGALVLLDGLDECGDAEKRERVMAAVDDLIDHAGDNCRFVLTARPYAWTTGADPSLGVYQLADLEESQIKQFIAQWYEASAKQHWFSPGEAAAKRDDLLASWQRPGLRELAGNPLLLTLMATLHSNTTRLPEDRADLYNQSVDLLMQRWNRRIGAETALLEALDKPALTLDHLRGVVEKLAFEAHKDNIGAEGAADIGEGKLRRAFSALLDGSHDKAGIVVKYIEERAGLLLGLGEKDGEPQFSFPHRTFQEYLAACHLAGMEQFATTCRELARAAPAHWQVVLPLAARIAKAERGAGAADGLVGRSSVEEFRKARQPEPADWQCAKLAGAMLQEIGPTGEDARPIIRRVAGWLAAALPVHPEQGGLPASQRAQCGDSLAALGDPRFDPRRLCLPDDPCLGFVAIPADPAFSIGTRTQDRERVKAIIGYVGEDEINDTTTPTQAFYLARYPVTVAQFRAFVEDRSFPLGVEDALRGPDNHPVCWISWHEARAYCDWLQSRLPGLPGFALAADLRQGGWRVDLPSELEWEKAARGGLPGKVFPWGDGPDPEQANYAETRIDGPSAVGCFPANGFGLHDMVGNVWEWTRTPYQAYPPKATDEAGQISNADDHFWVARGGSWDLNLDYARCAARSRYLPDGCDDDFGFRVILLPPLSPGSGLCSSGPHRLSDSNPDAKRS